MLILWILIKVCRYVIHTWCLFMAFIYIINTLLPWTNTYYSEEVFIRISCNNMNDHCGTSKGRWVWKTPVVIFCCIYSKLILEIGKNTNTLAETLSIQNYFVVLPYEDYAVLCTRWTGFYCILYYLLFKLICNDQDRNMKSFGWPYSICFICLCPGNRNFRTKVFLHLITDIRNTCCIEN